MPHHCRYGISYANALLNMEQNPKETADFMKHLFKTQQDNKLKQDPFYLRFCRKAVFSLCDGRVYLNKALEYAMDIPFEREHLATAIDALSKFGKPFVEIIQEQRGLQENGIARLNLQARTVLFAIDMMNSLYTEKHAGAYYL